MSGNLFPVPIDTPVTLKDQPQRFTEPWARYLKAVGDDLLEANIIRNSVETKAFKYTLNGNACFCIYSPTTVPAADVSITLPLPAAAPFAIGSAIYPLGTKSITIPAGTTFTQFWLLVSTSAV